MRAALARLLNRLAKAMHADSGSRWDYGPIALAKLLTAAFCASRKRTVPSPRLRCHSATALAVGQPHAIDRSRLVP